MEFRQANKYTMRWNQIICEKEIPHTTYGYWITNEGEFLQVSYENHDRVARSRGSYYGRAMDDGWIRVILGDSEHGSGYGNVLIINYQLGAIEIKAISAALKLIRQTDSEIRIEMTGRSYSGGVFSKSEAAVIIRKTSKKAIQHYTNDNWNWVVKYPLKLPPETQINEALLTEQNAVYEDMVQAFIRLFAKHDIELPVHKMADGRSSEAMPIMELRRELNWAKKNLRRKDRTVWFMWHARLKVISYLLDTEKRHHSNRVASAMFNKKKTPEPHDTLVAMQAVFSDYLNLYKKATGSGYPVHHSGDWGWVPKDTLQHFASLADAGAVDVERVVWSKQTPDQLIAQLERAEEKWKLRQGERQVTNSENDKIIHQFADGFQWVMLDRGSCDEEAKAMGHCGNVGSANATDRILSLRKVERKGKKKGLYPHLTFILHNAGKWGTLGEMKGRFNNKPEAKYHPYIVELLKKPFIKTVKGGGYMPQNNFSLNDLSDAMKQELYNVRGETNPLFLFGPEDGIGTLPKWKP